MRPESLFPLFKSVSTLKGIGPRLQALIGKVAGDHIIDLAFHLPAGLVSRVRLEQLSETALTRQVIVKALVRQHTPSRNRRIPYRVVCQVGDDLLTLTFFNGREDYLRRQLPEGSLRLISGKLEQYSGEFQITHPDHILSPDEEDLIPVHEPVYPLTAGLTNGALIKASRQYMETVPQLPEWIDPALLQREKWESWKACLEKAHTPEGEGDLSPNAPARQRLAYDELLSNQLALELVRRSMKRKPGRALVGNGSLRDAIERSLPFKLTHAQNVALSEIFADLSAPHRMLRLLQGDVGSGKTVVAVMAIAQAIEAGAQAALMAPTEILARQHMAAITPLAEAVGLKTALLTGRLKGKKRDAVLQQLASGEIHIAIGTHALFQDDVIYHDLGLAIIDEQHRFGVHQRLALSSKGRDGNGGVDVLVMTATPIPRTLALTAYGDMDVSIIAEKPPGRKPVDTRAIEVERLDDVAGSLGRKLKDGERIYWVCPLVEESEVSDLAAAEDRFGYLERLYPGQVGLVHGKMKADEKDTAMERFVSGETRILVATTVIEVGVDVPEATVMIIEHAERFGLAQLHQLRGRVGRGGLHGACLLLYAGPLGETQKARLNIMRETEDGFRIAEEDLRLRGAGELLGTRQSGLPVFKMADLQEHGRLLSIARDDARVFLENDKALATPRGQAVRTLLYLFERDSAIKYLQSG
ncbi:ATP-dependent DNA helicase RecG [Sneathiella chinensis]|uniref:ATP-dependent DNA helicase RecG n=1 Tax=Sneathiella chinensis TaxID=349750 RepID=A0ABQ5U582_9PROT|nr:ATP-dependent DNA helicase RecG [Sneathiella chinensis]GLQ07282.1 ATP-dependent DNA helicase RecG [Sneathiella chinensis]